MKGYGILSLIVVCVLLLMPLIVSEQSGQAAMEGTIPETVTVRYTNGETGEPMSLYELTLYETAAQMPPDAPLEAIKAQAVACFTLLEYQRRQHADESVQITETVLSFPDQYTPSFWQTQWGDRFEEYDGRYRQAVSAVYGQYLAYENQPIMALSHKMNSGQTEDGAVLLGESVPYLKAVASPADALAADQLTTVKLPLDSVKTTLTSLLGTAPTGEASAWFSKAEKTQAGTVVQMLVCSQPIEGVRLQNAFSLPSAAFDVSVQGEEVIFTVRGCGHFVGLSVVGATAAAKDGQTYEQILQHYYSGTVLQ